MNFTDYQREFDSILKGERMDAPYNDAHFTNYVKLNHSRQNRWLKKGILTEEIKSTIQSISKPQNWVLITEPWCGDAAHIVPFIALMAELNDNIHLTIQLRDSAGSEIDSYLTNNGKAIPKLIIRSETGEDLHVWGPRPKECQSLYMQLRETGVEQEELKIALQNWYNENEGRSMQEELDTILKQL